MDLDHRVYVCACDCGKVFKTTHACLRSGATRSCGCLRHESAARTSIATAKRKGSQESIFRSGVRELYRRYKKGADKRGHAFDLTYSKCVELFQKPCHYCGAAPAMVARPIGKYCTQAPFLANGLDRVDNALGYTIANTVPCCRTCNHMKSDRTVSQWFGHMSAVFAHSWKFP